MLCCEWVCKLLTAKAALFYNGHPPQTAEWAEVLTGAEPLYQTLSTVTQLKDSLGKAMKREQQPARLHQNTKLSPQSLKQERPAWMSLWCATTHHRDTPNKTIITPSHTYTVPDWSALQTRTVFSEIFFFNCCCFFFPPREKKGKKLLVSEPSAGVLLPCCFLNCNSNTVTSTAPDTRAAVVWHCLHSPWHPTKHIVFHPPLSEKKDFPCSDHIWDGAAILREQFACIILKSCQ